MDDKYGIELDLITSAFDKKIKNIKKQAESIKEAFDPNDVSGMTITELERRRKSAQNVLGAMNIPHTRADNYEEVVAKMNARKQSDKELLDYLKYMHEAKIATNETNAAIEEMNQSLYEMGTAESSVANLAAGFKKVVSSGAHKALNGIRNAMHRISDSAKETKTHMQNAFNGSHLKIGLKNILKYATALFSIRSIYSVLSQAARTWLSSQNEGAQQLSANIEYLKYSLGSVFAPVIEFITNLVYNLMKAIQSLIYSFTGINIFAKATASSMKSAAGSAKEASKALSSFDELNNLDNQSDNGGYGDVSPTFDLSNVDAQMTDWIESLKNKLAKVFEPLTKAWDQYGKPVIDSVKNAFTGIMNLGQSIGKSLFDVFQTGIWQKTAELTLRLWTAVFNIIGDVSNAFAHAWDNDSNGTKIIYNIWKGFNNIYEIIVSAMEAFEEWTSSEDFQNFADAIVKICETLSDWFQKITDKLKEIWDNGGKETFEKVLEFCGKAVEAISAIVEALSPLVSKILEVVTPVLEDVIKIIGNIIDVLNGVLDFIIGVFSGDWERAWQGIQDAFWGIMNGLGRIIKVALNVVIMAVEGLLNGLGGALNFFLGAISDIVSGIGGMFGFEPINLRIPYISLPKLDTGTNYVPEDQLAMIHQGEAVIPKKFNAQEYFGGDDETKTLLEEIKEAINNIEINPYTTIKDVGKTAVNYINSRSRQLGGSVID